jgi:predicted DNA-binding transcriptional regulator AlpA
MTTSTDSIRFIARVTVEIEDLSPMAETLRESIVQTFKTEALPSLAVAATSRPLPVARESVQLKAPPMSKDAESENLLLDTKQVAKLLSIGERTLWRHANSGRVLKPIKVGSAVRWNARELRQWVEAGCPTHEKWAQMRRK